MMKNGNSRPLVPTKRETLPVPFMSHKKYLEMTAHLKFKPGSLCWARLDASRIWPAVVMDPAPLDFHRYPYGVTRVFIFVNFLVVDYHAFVPETEIWDYRTGAEMFSKTNAARTKALTQAVNKIKGMSEVPSSTEIVDNANCDELGQTSKNQEVDVYEFDEDSLGANEQIAPFSQAGRKTNSAIQDLQSNQLNVLEPKVVLERHHIGEEYTQKDKSVKTSGKEEKLTRNEVNGNVKKNKQQGKKTKGKGKSKQLPEEEFEKKVKKRKTEQKIKEPVENAEKIVKKRKVEKKKQKEVPEEKAKEEPKIVNVEKEESEVEGKSRSGRVIRKIEPYQVKPKERKPREKREKKKIQYLKVKIQKKKPTPSAESIFKLFQDNVNKPLLKISLTNMPANIPEILESYGERLEPPETKFGLFGLGTFGRHLATKLLLSCHKVYLWDRSEWKVRKLLEDICEEDASVLIKSSPEELVTECDYIIFCLADFRTVEFFLHDHREILPLLRSKGVLNLTTMTGYHSEFIKRKIVQYGARYLTVGLTGVPEESAMNKFNAIVSGDEELFGDCLTCLSAISDHIYYMDKSQKAVDVAKLLDVIPASFNIACSTILPVCKSYNLEPSALRTTYEAPVRHSEPSAMDNEDMWETDPHLFNNYLSPGVMSERLNAVMDHAERLGIFPMIETLREMYRRDN